MSDNSQEAQVAAIADACQKAASLGFVTHLKTAGVSDDKIKKLHSIFIEGLEKQASKIDEMRDSILEGLGRKAK